MRLLGMAALAGVGVLAYRAMKKNRENQHSSQQLRPEDPRQAMGGEAMNGERHQDAGMRAQVEDRFTN